MYYSTQAWAIFASLLTVAAGIPSTIASELYSPSTLIDIDGSRVIAQESEPETPEPETPEAETPETPEPETPEPETPEPETPETPEPETPEPETPDTPQTPVTPTEPEPEIPDTPQTPVTPEVPSAPVEPPTEETMPTGETETETEALELILDAQGELVEGDQLLESDNSLYDEYTFEGEEGQSVTVTLESSEFDTYLAIFTPNDKLLEEHDDISQTDSNSEITVTLPTTGVYRVIVNSYDSKGRGAYTLKIR